MIGDDHERRSLFPYDNPELDDEQTAVRNEMVTVYQLKGVAESFTDEEVRTAIAELKKEKGPAQDY